MRCLCAVLLVLSFVFGIIPSVGAVKAESEWEIQIQSIELFDELHSVTTEIAYDGTVSYVNHDDYPDEGSVFAVVKLSAGKLDLSAQALDITELKLHAGQGAYPQMQDDSFLENHGYSTFEKYNGSLMTDTQGAACFEVPEELLLLGCDGWYLTAGEYTSAGYVPDESTEIPVEPDLIERQAKTEKAILTQFEAQDDKSLQNALVVVNPYEIAPLTALILFDTEEAVTVSVTVYGLTEDTNITYTVDKPSTHHEIPVFGLYGGRENRVWVETSNGDQRNFRITTTPLPADLPEYTATVTEQSSFDNSGLMYVLGIPHRYCIDVKGHVRWYSTLEESPGMPEETNEDGSYWTISPGGSLGAKILNLTWLGKVLSSYAYYNFTGHHDLDIVGDTLLYFTGTTIQSVDLETGRQSEYLRLGSILDPDLGYVDNRNDPADWAHQNTIEYADGKLYLSLRNQSMLIKMDYATKQIEWVATLGLVYDDQGNVTGALQDGISEYLVLPTAGDAEFEWFWSQHDISIMPDQDDNPDTDDFTLFDNGVYRGDPDTPTSKMYSRLVQYRVDTEEKTITQIFSYADKENGLHSPAMSSTQAITNGQFGCFSDIYNEKTGKFDVKLIEVDEFNGAVGIWHSENTHAYRAYYYPVEIFVPQEIDLSAQNPAFEYYQTTEWADYPNSLPTSDGLHYEIKSLSVSEDGMLDITGWAVIAGYSDHFATPFLVVDGESTGTKYILLQYTYNEIAIPSDLINPGDYSSGFWGVGVDLSQLPDDVYTVGLLVNANGTGQWRYADLGYTYTKGDAVNVARSDILEQQGQADTRMLNAYQSGEYTFQNPYIAVDPYGISPLSAIALFSTDAPATISLEVAGKNGAAPVTQQFETLTTQHQIPIYGLYAGETTQVRLTAHYNDGTSETQMLTVMGNGLPSDFVPVGVVSADTNTAEMADGWTFLMAGSLQGYVYAIDEAGSVRWMLSEKGLGAASVFLPLENGNYLVGGDKSFGNYYKYNLFELDLTGRIVHEYLINGYHHDAVELPSGNLLLLANNINGQVMEDTLYELDRETGEILRTWDFNAYFNVGNYNEAGQHIADVNYGTGASDWLHINGIDYNEQTNSLLLSSRHQDAVFSMDLGTGAIEWILSDPNDLWPEYLADKLLTPVGDGFEWQYGQHNAIWLPDGNIMLFDNGDYRSKTPEGILDAATQAYSRAVIFHVDQQTKTVSQVWEFGKEKGTDHFAVNVSSVQYLGENHYLIDFGGIVKNSAGEATYNIMDGITGSSRSEVYEIKDGAVVFHANVNRSGLYGNTFRAIRVQPYASAKELDLSVSGERLGSLYCYGLAMPVSFTADDAVSSGPEVLVTDNGVQLLFSAELEYAANDLAVIFAGAGENYQVALPAGASISYTLNKSELPTGTYRLYLVQDGTIYDLALRWTNTTAARAFPVGYDIEVTTSKEGAGAVYGSGTYYANTPFTVWVSPSSDATFVGWYSNGILLSKETSYTLTATQDMVLTAAFEDDQGAGGGSVGGGGGGGAIGGGAASGDQSAETTNPDGSTTTTVTNDDGSKTDTTTSPNGASSVVNTDQDGNVSAEATLPSSVVNEAMEKGEVIALPMPALTINAGKTATVSVKLPSGVSAAVEIPVEQTTAGMVAVLMKADDKEEVIKTSFATENGVIVTLSDGDIVKIVDNAKVFSDVPSNFWGKDAIAFATSHELFSGTGENTFAPNANMSRAMIVTVLARLEGVDTTTGTTWYEAGRQWAMETGISDGTNMDGYLTREQLAAMLYRYAGESAVNGQITGFCDTASVSEWAVDAMTWAVSNGIITGSDGALNPQGLATRAQVAAMLQRFIVNVNW